MKRLSRLALEGFQKNIVVAIARCLFLPDTMVFLLLMLHWSLDTLGSFISPFTLRAFSFDLSMFSCASLAEVSKLICEVLRVDSCDGRCIRCQFSSETNIVIRVTPKM
jgi:hypothetical protein